MPVMAPAMGHGTKHVGCFVFWGFFFPLNVHVFTGSRENIFSLIFVFKGLLNVVWHPLGPRIGVC